MAKLGKGNKMKKKGLSEMKQNVKKKPKSINPFEVHLNKQKFNILGRKLKNDRGLPGIARAKALKKRKETLLQEYKIKDKSNKFLDRRLGEKNSAMTNEDKIIARFTAERMKAHKRKTLFNLADDEVLTHKGRSLAEVERFDDPRSDDEDDDCNRKGGLDASFVEDAHFGGGMLKKTENNRMSVIDQLIADSKKRKAEKQELREKTLEKTEALDRNWKELLPCLTMGKAPENDNEKKDPYDILMNELKFDAKGKPSDKLKSVDEIAAEEAKKLQKLEEERIQRMRGGDAPVIVKTQHRSADDLDDGFEIDDNEFTLEYDKDGNLIRGVGEEEKTKGDSESEEPDDVSLKEDEDSSEEDDEDDVESGDEDNECNPDEGPDDLSDMKAEELLNSDSEEDVETDENIEKVEEEQVTGNYDVDVVVVKSHIGSVVENINRISSTSPEENDGDNSKESPALKESCSHTNSSSPKKQVKVLNEKKKVSFKADVAELCTDETKKNKAEIKLSEKEFHEYLIEKKELMETARKELPYTFNVPETYEELQDLFKNHSPEEQAVIVERMIKCNHPSLRETNKMKLESLFAFLLQHLNDCSYKECWSVLDCLAPLFFELTQFSPSNAANCLREVIEEKHSDYYKKKQKYPPVETLLFLKLVPLLFPTSDKRHPVTTPTLVFMCEMLGQCKVTSRRTIASGLFIVSLITEFVNLSKRICPEAINFLCGILHLATPPSSLKVSPPFKQEHKFLYLHNKVEKRPAEKLKMFASDLALKSDKIDDDFRIRSLFTALSLLNIFIGLYKNHSEVILLLDPIKKHFERIEAHKYPGKLQELIKHLTSELEEISKRKLSLLAVEAKRPKALRLYEPNIQPVYEGSRKRKMMSEEKAEHEKLVHKIKRETKGALREIRRDRLFLANIKIKEQMASDQERMQKVKQIYSWGAQQQGELNKIKRSKKK